MFSEDDVITLLKASTKYSIEYTKERDFNLLDLGNLNTIYVGYDTIMAKNPAAPIEFDLYNTFGEDLVQTFQVNIVCLRKDLPTIWKDCYKALIGKNPVPLEKDRSGFTIAESGPMGFSNNAVWWLNRWRIGFPTVWHQF